MGVEQDGSKLAIACPEIRMVAHIKRSRQATYLRRARLALTYIRWAGALRVRIRGHLNRRRRSCFVARLRRTARRDNAEHYKDGHRPQHAVQVTLVCRVLHPPGWGESCRVASWGLGKEYRRSASSDMGRGPVGLSPEGSGSLGSQGSQVRTTPDKSRTLGEQPFGGGS